MKKIIIVFLAMFLISGCISQKNKALSDSETQVYSFNVDSENIEIHDGVIVVEPDYQVFSGGKLEFKKTIDEKITHIEKRFYIQKGDMKQTIATSQTGCEEGISLEMNLSLPEIAGGISQDFDGVYDNLYFELKLTFENKDISTYNVRLNVKDVTKIGK